MPHHPALVLIVLAAVASGQPPARQGLTPAHPRAAASAAPMVSHVNPALFRGAQYRLVGPSRGGRVTAVAGVPSQPKTFYMGVASGGLFRTVDAGLNWVPISDGKIPVGSMGSIAVADSDPEDHLRRHRLGRPAQQRVDGAGRLQDHRRRGDVAFRRAVQRGADCRRSHPSHQPRHRVGRGNRGCLQAQRPARGLQDRGRREDLEKGPVRRRRGRGDGRGGPPGQPDARVCVDVAARTQALDDHQRLEGRRFLQEHGRRGQLREDHRGPAFRPDWEGQPGGDRRPARSHLWPDRGAPGRRLVPLGRQRQDVDPRQHAALVAAAALLLHDARGRPDERRRRVRGRRRLFQVGGRRQGVRGPAHPARRQPRHLDQPERRPHHDPGERRRGERLDGRRPDMVVAAQSADRRVLRSVGRRQVSLPSVRRAAGQHDRDHHEPGRAVRA